MPPHPIPPAPNDGLRLSVVGQSPDEVHEQEVTMRPDPMMTASAADVAEQERDLVAEPDEWQPTEEEQPIEADPADVSEQRVIVETDEEAEADQ
jgi:hypothetical protein